MGLFDPDATVAGFKISTLFAGSMGGVVSALTGKESFWASLVTVFVGMVCAAYMTPYALRLGSQFLYFSPAEEGAAAFLVGLTGQGVMSVILRIVRRVYARTDDIVDARVGK